MSPHDLVLKLSRTELQALVVDLAGVSPDCHSADSDEEVCTAILQQLLESREAYNIPQALRSKVRT